MRGVFKINNEQEILKNSLEKCWVVGERVEGRNLDL